MFRGSKALDGNTERSFTFPVISFATCIAETITGVMPPPG